MYKYLFGPVPSRRLGMSLGIDLVTHKICSMNCVYCESGLTTNLTIERKEYVPVDKVIKELKHFLLHNPSPDYLTFSGSGEPTLNSGIGRVLKFIKSNYPIPIAVLTNGTLLSNKQVRTELLNADIVIPSLDAVSDSSFRKIDRAFHKINIKEYIQGLVDFRNEFSGKINLEVFILPGYNDNIYNLELLKKAFLRINPDTIQLNTLDRPGTIDNLRSASISELQSIANFWNLQNITIISSSINKKNIVSCREDLETAILETIRRRPCTREDIIIILGKQEKNINKYLVKLEKEHKITTIKQTRGLFYKAN